MNFPFFIARRYFFSKKKQSFINVIAILSILGVAGGTMALVIVLSVFNGLEGLIRNIYSSFDPHLKIIPASGKSFVVDKNFLQKIETVDGVKLITEVVEDNALVKYNDKQTIVKMKGVSDNFQNQYNIARYVREGIAGFSDKGVACALLGQGIQYKLGIDMENKFYQMQFWYPRNKKKIDLNPENAFNSANLFPGGVFSLEKQYDDYYVFVPLNFAVELMDYGNKRTSLEINVSSPDKISGVQEKLEHLLGENFLVLSVEEQHSSMLRALKIERLFMYATFTFILLICTLNIYFTLTMLVIEKKNDMEILNSFGAPQPLIKNIFIAEGLLISTIGAILGLIGGFIICFLQQKYGFVSMGSVTSLVNAYPVQMKISDFVTAGALIFLITFLISYQPAAKAAQVTGRIQK